MKLKGQIGFLSESPAKEGLSRVEEMYQKAVQFHNVDPEIALLQSRRLAESVCRELFIEYVQPFAEAITLDSYIDLFLERQIVPKPVAIHLRVIQILTEDYENDDAGLFATYVSPCLQSVTMVKNWYLQRSGRLEETSAGAELQFLELNALPISSAENLSKDARLRGLASSTFADANELQGILGDDGIIVGKEVRLNESSSFEHCVIVGPTGSGKSAGFFIPNLLSFPHASFVVSDPKGELYRTTQEANRRQGKKILLFEPGNPESIHYNPLSLCQSETDVIEISMVLLANGMASMSALSSAGSGGAEWILMSTPLLAAVLLYVKDLRAPRNSISHALELIVQNSTRRLDSMLKGNEQAYSQFTIFMQSNESDRTAASIRTVLSSYLQLFADPTIKQFTSTNEIDPILFRQEPTALYLSIPETKSSFFAPLMATFYHQLFGYFSRGSAQVPVYFFLDEFANIGTIPGIDSALATFRSRRIGLALGLQSINQLRQRYGEATATSILDNIKCKAVLPGLSYDTARYFSDLLGDTEVITQSTSRSLAHTGTVTYNSAPQVRPLMSPDEIRRLPSDDLLIVIGNLKPVIVKQNRYYEDAALLSMSQSI